MVPEVEIPSHDADMNSLCNGCRLPERIRPAACAFGSLADSFLPFQQNDRTAEIHTASIVMKAVQARLQHPELEQQSQSGSSMVGCGKLGDDADQSKAQASHNSTPPCPACDPCSSRLQ